MDLELEDHLIVIFLGLLILDLYCLIRLILVTYNIFVCILITTAVGVLLHSN